MSGQGKAFLDRSFGHLSQQDFDDFEVVVSDQSSNSDVYDLCQTWLPRLNIRHVWNLNQERQAAANTNNAIEVAQSNIVKVLFQDDFLCSSDALSQTYSAFETDKSDWLLCGSGITIDGLTVEKPMVPKLTERMHFGRNTVSSPSVFAMRKSCSERFDENLIWLVDVEFYRRMWRNHGDPIILEDTLIANAIHDAQVSASISHDHIRRELDYVWNRFGDQTSLSGRLEYVRKRIKLALKPR